MARPIQMIRGGERQTVYNEAKAKIAEREGWLRISNLTAQQLDDLQNLPKAPWADYDTMTVDQVLQKAEGLDAAAIEGVLTYEHATKNRKGVMTALRKPIAPITVETVVEEPLKTTETVEIVVQNRGPESADQPVQSVDTGFSPE
jgi:hypothetical protein